jgi:hypothetical protein
MPAALTRWQNAKIEDAYRDGLTLRVTAHEADCSTTSVEARFKLLKAEGVPRGERNRRIFRSGRRYSHYGWPAPYHGPEWIGKACT